MKRLVHALAFGLALIGLVGAALAAPPAYRLGIDGLACPFCAYGIEKQLHKLDGVAGIDIDIAEGQVLVRLNEGSVLDEATARAAVERAGFTLRGFEQVDEGAAKD